MAFTITAKQEQKAFDKIPTGLYDAELDEITEPKEYPGFPDAKTGQVKPVMKSRWIFKITGADDNDEVLGEKISSFVNMEGAGEKSNLYKTLKGLGLNPDYQYDTDELLGRKCKLYVKVETNKNGKTSSNITDITPKKGQPTLGRPVPEASDEASKDSIPF